MEYEQPQKTASAKIVAADDSESGSNLFIEQPLENVQREVPATPLRGAADPPPIAGDAAPSKAMGIFPYYFLRMFAAFIDLFYSALLLSFVGVIVFSFAALASQSILHLEDWCKLLIGSGLLLCMFPLVESNLIQYKIVKSDRQTSLGKFGVSLYLVDIHGRPLGRKRKMLRSFAKFGIVFFSLYCTYQFRLPIFVIPLLMFNRRFIHDYVSGTCVVSENEDPKTTFYPRGSVWTKVIMCWVALCLIILPFKWRDIESRAKLLYSEHFATVNEYKIDAIEEVLYPGLKEREKHHTGFDYFGGAEVLEMKRLALYSSAVGHERLALLNRVIILRERRFELDLIAGSDLTKLIEMEERSKLAYKLGDANALRYFQESIQPMLYSPGDKLPPDENPFVMYARLLAQNGQFQKARDQIKEYRWKLSPESDPSNEECEKTLRNIDELQKQRTK